MNSHEWESLIHLKPSMFQYPDKVKFSVVHALDQFVGIIGSKPVIISDYRPGDPKQHGKGLAIDTVWSGIDALTLWGKAIGSKLFNGLGIYLNEKGAISFHFDKRTERTPDNPARWGCFITHPYDPETATHVRADEYTTAEIIISELKKKGIIVAVGLIAFGYAIYRLLSTEG